MSSDALVEAFLAFTGTVFRDKSCVCTHVVRVARTVQVGMHTRGFLGQKNTKYFVK